MAIKEYMLGTDVSHHNVVDFTYCGNQGFVFLKATEGNGYVDNNMDNDLKEILHNPWGVPPFIGFYHYAHPEYNTPASEAKHFLDTIRPHIGNCMCALDIEGTALTVKNIDMWALQWMMTVEKETGSTPILYVQASGVRIFPAVSKRYPLWVACYSQESRETRYKQEIEQAKFIQLTSHPLDIDIFKGTPVDMARLINKEII